MFLEGRRETWRLDEEMRSSENSLWHKVNRVRSGYITTTTYTKRLARLSFLNTNITYIIHGRTG